MAGTGDGSGVVIGRLLPLLWYAAGSLCFFVGTAILIVREVHA